MKAVSGKKLASALERNGWVRKRVQGSHHIYIKEGDPARISVPIHGNKALKTGLFHHLMKQAGLKERDL